MVPTTRPGRPSWPRPSTTSGPSWPAGRIAGQHRFTLIVGAMADKDVAGVVRALAASPALAGAQVICTEVEEARALPADDLAGSVVGGRRSRSGLSGPRPRPSSWPSASAPGPVVVAGSLYLVGAIRAMLVDDPLLRDVAASG